MIAHLVQELFEGSLEEAVIQALRKIEGTYGIAVISSRDPGKIVAARKGSPLLIGVGVGENFLASDASAILAHTRQVVYLDDGDVAVIEADKHRVIDLSATPLRRAVDRIDWDLAEIEIAAATRISCSRRYSMAAAVGREHDARPPDPRRWNGKARRNQPVARRPAADRQRHHHGVRHELAFGADRRTAHRGTRPHPGGSRVRVRVSRYTAIPIVTERTLCIVMAAVGARRRTRWRRGARPRRGARTLGLVERRRLDDPRAKIPTAACICTPARKIGVASFQGVHQPWSSRSCPLITLKLARKRDISVVRGSEIAQALHALPAQIQDVLDRAPAIEEIAERFKDATNFLYLGRGYNFPAALEGALKLKEISYIHAEGYPAAEMKHGPIALIDESMPVVFIAPHDAVFRTTEDRVEHSGGERRGAVWYDRDHEPRRAGAEGADRL